MNEATGHQQAGLQITFREDVTDPEQRLAAERSVAALIAHSTDASARARAAEAELDRLGEALNAPLIKLIHADKAAASALQTLAAKKLLAESDLAQLKRDDPARPLIRTETSLISADTIEPRPPFSFWWSYYEGNNRPHSQRITPENGYLGVEARSGAVDGGAAGFVKAHIGYGVVLPRVNRPTQILASSGLYNPRWVYNMRTFGIGSSATAEMGGDAAAFEEGHLLGDVLSTKFDRRRISGVESARTDYHPIGISLDIPTSGALLRFTMNPGRTYTINIGIWVLSDRSGGVGAAAVQSLIEGFISKITITRI
jgi:hypothetical protein